MANEKIKNSDFYINKKDFGSTKWQDCTLQSQHLNTGEVRVKVQSFSLTANNITYALLGDKFAYWQFFPTEDHAWGRLPVWGFAEVVESRSDDVSVGERLYGCFPLASHWILKPTGLNKKSFMDGSAHRAQLPAIYSQYSRVTNDSKHSTQQESLQALLKPLFTTAYMLDDFLLDNHFFESENILLSSASSKTAIATAHTLNSNKSSQRRNYKIIGFTSSTRKDYLVSLGCYDQVYSYDEIPLVSNTEKSVYLDFSGNNQIRNDIHQHLKSNLMLNSQIGVADWSHVGDDKDLPGPKPQVFFAPNQIQKRIEELGPDALFQKIKESWERYLIFAAAHFDIVTLNGTQEIANLYQKILQGNIDASKGNILTF